MNIDNFLNDLASNGSRLYKEAQLEKQKDNNLLKTVIHYALDPFRQFYIRKIPEYSRDSEPNHPTPLTDCIEALDILSNREKTGHAAIAHLQDILGYTSLDNAKVIERIIAKDLKCGVSVSTVNKIWPGLIPEFPVMLASGSDSKLIENMKWPAYAELKMDGMRFNAIVRDGKVDLRARSGKSIELHGYLVEEFLESSEGNDLVFDGELWVADNSGKPLPRKVGNGILNRAIKGTIPKDEANRVHCTLWDLIEYKDWITEKSEVPLIDRRKNLRHLLYKFGPNKTYTKLNLIEYFLPNSYEEAQQIFQDYLEKGEEGIILKNIFSPWEARRSKHHIKFKAEKDADLLCVGWEEGTGKHKGKIGSLKLETSDGLIKVSVGTGLKDADREKDPSFYLGKIIQITYNERIKSDSDKEESLFLPVFNQVRLDKTIANSSKELK